MNISSYSLLLFFLLPGGALAQKISFGVKGGVPLTETFRFSGIDSGPGPVSSKEEYFSRTKRYTVGPTLEVGLPRGLSIEFNALYKRLNYDYNAFYKSPSSGRHFINTKNTANRWEFPVLLKYRFYRVSSASIRPHVSVGASWNHVSGEENFRESSSSNFGRLFSRVTTSSELLELHRKGTMGFVIGSGVEFRFLLMRVSPEIRYTRWGQENFQKAFPAGPILRSNLNQVEFLVGISF